jgi:hypothetical protein
MAEPVAGLAVVAVVAAAMVLQVVPPQGEARGEAEEVAVVSYFILGREPL